ncbi:hypothetical protein TeGR_g10254, partial [Tetraparma gracilis]
VRSDFKAGSGHHFAEDLRFRDFFGASGVFVATALLAQVVLAVILGFRAEVADISDIQVVCLHGIAAYAAFHLFNSVVYWRSLVEGLFDVQEGNMDPLEALNIIPAAKRLMKWYHDNFAIHTGGKYSLLLVIGAEVFELMVQATNANFMAGYLPWPALSFYGTLISTNCILFGVCMLSDERFISESVVITVDVIMDACYIVFNIFYVSNPASYWAIIVPLLLSVDMLNDSMTLRAHESVQRALFKQSARRKNEESKANGTDLVAAPPNLEMLNASFCGVDDITGEQAVELQDRNMVLHGNPVMQITWAYQGALTKIPAWLRLLEKVSYANLEYCDVKEIKGGAFPASLEELNIKNQVAGLRLHPDSFEGLSKLQWLEICTNKLTEDDMHPGLFGDAKLEKLMFLGNPGMLNFDAAALFPGSSGQQLLWLGLENCGLTGIGGESGTNLNGLLALEELWLGRRGVGEGKNDFGDGIAEDAFNGLAAAAASLGPEVGGERVVDAVVAHCAGLFARKNAGLDVFESGKAIARLRLACEIAVRTLANPPPSL